MNKKQIKWVLTQLQKLVDDFNESELNWEEIVNKAKEITDASKDHEYVRMLVLDVMESIEVEYGNK